MVSIEVPLENLKTKRMRTEVFSHDLGNLHRYDNIYIYILHKCISFIHTYTPYTSGYFFHDVTAMSDK